MSLRFAVLGLLSIRPASGYELARHIETTLPQVWYARNNQLYAELAKLADDGFAEIVEEGPRGRRVYAATEVGRAELWRWLVEAEPDRKQRSEVALRDFLLPELRKDDALRVLERETRHLAAELGETEELLRRMAELASPDDVRVLATEHRRLLTEARLEWSRLAARRIAARQD
ncbi:PadR family transcriptional regulator [Kitasatospora sp. NPDC056138]|uniref:PadR family transcriptional regulator n=1 Tax=Kitasatospora sp. NPDC056138 TaxID=3345724 RepID=UPI0035DDBA19